MDQPMTLTQALERAIAHEQAGQLREAEAIYRQILSVQADQPDALHLLGLLAMRVGRADVAVDLIGRAAAVNPSSAEVLCNLATALRTAGRSDEAVLVLQNALRLRPHFPEAHFNLGNVFRAQKKSAEALASYRRAVSQKADYPAALSNLGSLLHETGQTDEAIDLFGRALALQPVSPQLHNNLGHALLAKERFDDAVRAFRVAIGQDPRDAMIRFNLANALRMMGRFQEALEQYHSSIELDPSVAEVRFRWNRSTLQLLLGDYEAGWGDYQSRWHLPELGRKRQPFAQPEWDGMLDLRGKRMLVYCDHGLGDFIQFSRYVPMLAARGAEVILGCPPELTRLMRSLQGVALITGGDPVPPMDLHGDLLSLAGHFRTTVDTIPAVIPYLRADPQETERWRGRIESAAAGALKVGLVWAGNPTHADDRLRSIPVRTLQPLMAVERVQWFSLQKGAASEQMRDQPLAQKMADFTADLHDLADTGAMINNLDLVITADTAVAHLAGSLGRPAWVLLPMVPDWRWMLNRTDSPWYPTLRLFRQPRHHDWASVVEQVVEALQQFKIEKR